MNLIELCVFGPPCSVTAMGSEAPARVARWEDWFRLATCVLNGELFASRWRDL